MKLTHDHIYKLYPSIVPFLRMPMTPAFSMPIRAICRAFETIFMDIEGTRISYVKEMAGPDGSVALERQTEFQIKMREVLDQEIEVPVQPIKFEIFHFALKQLADMQMKNNDFSFGISAEFLDLFEEILCVFPEEKSDSRNGEEVIGISPGK